MTYDFDRRIENMGQIIFDQKKLINVRRKISVSGKVKRQGRVLAEAMF